jgi:hypothetical protein
MSEILRSPFSPLPVENTIIWNYVVSLVNEADYVELVFSDLNYFEYVDSIEIASDFNIRFIRADHLSSGNLVFPPDSYNFSNFDIEALDSDQAVALNKVADFYKRLSAINPKVSKDQIVFSMEKQTIFIIPKAIEGK